MPPKTHSEQLKQDISQNLAAMLRHDTEISPQAAMRKVTTAMLANNPFVPPTGCPVNDLPNELLAYIFLVGAQMEEDGDIEEEEDVYEYVDKVWASDEEDGDSNSDAANSSIKNTGSAERGGVPEDQTEGDDDEDEGDNGLLFQELVSHVCRHWRGIALESPALWTTLNFAAGTPIEKSVIWIQRSKGLPLDIDIDCSVEAFDPDDERDPEYNPENNSENAPGAPNGNADGQVDICEHCGSGRSPSGFSLADLSTALDTIIPHVAQWRSLEVAANHYDFIYLLLQRLSQCPSAPLLETLQLYHYEDGEDYERFAPVKFNTSFLIFNGLAPKLTNISLWGIHIDWDRSLSFLAHLREFELAYHARDVRPSFATFSKIIQASPEIQTLTLCLSGPAKHDDIENDWGVEPLEIPSLTNLVLCYHDPVYISDLMRHLYTPNVHSLALDYDESDYTEFAQQLTKPLRGKSKSLLAGLEHMKISGLPCDNKTAEMILEQLAGLKTLNLDCSGMEEIFFDLLGASFWSRSGVLTVYCPNLQTITTSGIEGSKMRSFVEARKVGGAPLKKVYMSEDDHISPKDERWLRDHLEGLEFFEPSESEEEFYEDGEDDGSASEGLIDEDEDEDEDEMQVD